MLGLGGNAKSKRQIELVRRAGDLVAGSFKVAKAMIQPGVSTGEINAEVEKYILSEGGIPVFKGYQGHFGAPPFPGSICASINEEVVHGIPSFDRKLVNGDILSVDVGVKLDRFIGDSAFTFPVGEISDAAKALLRCCRGSLENLIPQLKAGFSLYELGKVVQDYVEERGFSVVTEYVGHGLGKNLHEDPQIPHYADENLRNNLLKEGMVIAVEPMVNAGVSWTEKMADRWTVVTKDRKLSAHFEHTMAVGKNGVDILTGWPD